MVRGKKTKEVSVSEQKLAQALVPLDKQPYQVPSNWMWVHWGKCGYFIAGNGFKNEFQGFTDYHIPFYKVGSLKYIDSEGYLCDMTNTIDEELRAVLKASLIPVNSILFAKIGEAIRLNRRALNAIPCCIDNNMMAFVPSICNYKYVLYWSRILDLYDYTNATTVPAIRKSDLEEIPFPFAPLSEQKRIVSRIEDLFAKLDEAREKAQAVMDSFDTRKAAILHKALTGELSKKWRRTHNVKIEDWENLTLNDIASYKKGPFGSSITKAMFVPKGSNTYKVYEQGNAIRKTINYGHYYISQEKYIELKSFSVKSGDIIISCAGTIGEAFTLPIDCEPGVINQALMRVRIGENINTSYFLYYFAGVIKSNVNNEANGTAIKNIPPFNVMKAMEIRLPSLDEQAEIVSILDDLLAKEQQARNAGEAVLRQIDIIKKSILTRAFRGELGTNDPTEESAVELLKAII